MSDKTRQRIEIGLIALAFGAGGGWAAYTFKLSALEDRMNTMTYTVERIDSRVSAMYCASIPEPQRAACR